MSSGPFPPAAETPTQWCDTMGPGGEGESWRAMAEPMGPGPQGPAGAQGVQEDASLQKNLRDASAVDRFTVIVGAVVLIDAFLPWNGAELLTGGQSGITSGVLAVVALVAGMGAGALVLGRLAGALDLGENADNIALALGAATLGFTALHLFTEPALTTTGVYVALVCGALLSYFGAARKRGDSLATLESPQKTRGAKRAPITSSMITSKLMRVVRLGPILGSLASGAMLYPVSHSLITMASTAIAMMVLLMLLRLGEGVLRPVWMLVGAIPPVLRLPAGVIVPLYISISRAQPDAGGTEIEATRTSLFLSVVLVYVLFHGPPKEQHESSATPIVSRSGEGGTRA